MMPVRYVSLENSPIKAMVDSQDYERVSAFTWYLVTQGNRSYATKNPDIRDHHRLLGRFILNTPKGVTIRYENKNGLDNRRENLRQGTRQEVAMSRTKRSDTQTSHYKGVSWHKQSQKWNAQIFINGKHLSLGNHEHEEAAARAYDKAAKHHFGDLAETNFK